MQNSKRLKREHETISRMIALYCHAHHHPPQSVLCSECQLLLDYAHQRIERCPYGWEKPTCANCPIHCYQPDRREQIRQVMRYAGPRMLWHHPRLAVLHLVDGLRKLPER